MDNTVKIVGVKITPSKTKKDAFGYTYFFTKGFDDYAVETSDVYGVSTGSAYIGKDLGCKVGDEVELKYTPGFEGKAQLIGCTIVKPANVAGK